MKSIAAESLLRRISYLKRAAVRRRKIDLWKDDGDRASLMRRLRAGYSLLVYFSFALFLGRKSWLTPGEWAWDAWIFNPLTIVFMVYLIWNSFRIRWAVKVFDVFWVEDARDLPGS